MDDGIFWFFFVIVEAIQNFLVQGLKQNLDHLAEEWNNKDMLTTVIGAYPKPSYLRITDWFNASGGTDTEYPSKHP